jgi:hypothetical protein
MLTASADTTKCKCGNVATVTRRSGNYCTSCLVASDIMRNATPKTHKVLYLNSELAIPIGINDGTRIGGTRKPRMSDGIHHPCLVTRSDGSQYVITTTRNVKRLQRQAIAAIPAHRLNAADLRPVFAD